MMQNESALDRTIRFLAGLALVSLWWPFAVLTGTWAVVLAVVGALLVATGVIGFCPIYRALGMSTKPAKRTA